MSKVLAAVESYLMCVRQYSAVLQVHMYVYLYYMCTKKWTLLCLVEITAGDLSITRLVDYKYPYGRQFTFLKKL